MIKYVLIDIDDTLLDFQLCARSSLAEVCRQTGVPFSEDFMKVFHKITRFYWDKIESGTLTRKELYKVRFNAVFEKLGVSYDGEEFEELYHKELYESDILIEGARELVIWLSERTVLCAASNATYAQQHNRLKKTGLLPYFTHLFLSEQIGAEKPSEKFFEYALNTLGAKPDEVLIIGDSLSADIAGGVKCGIHTCHYLRNKNTPTGEILPEYSVEKLSDITKLSLFS